MMLRPIARFCIRNSLVIQDLLECIKVVLVDEANRELMRVGGKVNVSRVSVVTGVHRRDVMRLTDEKPTPPTPGLIDRVLGQWEQDKRFRTSNGSPKLLSYEGDQSEFKELVRCVSQDLNYCTVLFELDRIGAVERTGKGLKLRSRSVLINDDVAKGFTVAAQDSEDLLSAVMENLLEKPTSPNLHARTEYDNISKEALPEIRSWLLREGAEFHRKMRDHLSRYDADINPALKGKGGAKVVVGAFGRVISEETKVRGAKKS